MYLFIFKSKKNYPFAEVIANTKEEAEGLLENIGFDKEDFYITNILSIWYQTQISGCPLKNCSQKEKD